MVQRTLSVFPTMMLSTMSTIITTMMTTLTMITTVMGRGAAHRCLICMRTEGYRNLLQYFQVDSDGVHVSGQGKWGYCSDDCYAAVPTGKALTSSFYILLTLVCTANITTDVAGE